MPAHIFPGRSGTHFLILFLALAAGCGGESAPKVPVPELGKVSGIVTLDGNPLEGATVIFEPSDITADRRESRAVTGGDGRYELVYVDDVKGAVLGNLTVRISKLADDKQVVPEKYNMASKETREVKAGDNSFNFDLTSK